MWDISTAFNHAQSHSAEAEYDRLRNLARQEQAKKQSCFDRAHEAYERGDGAAAHNLSEEGKRHGQAVDQYNKQASDFIFRENNAVGRVDADTIDLHGQYVEEAEDILEQRIRYAQGHGQGHLHVIVGRGNHSVDHVQKLKPRVEQLCRELGLQYETEENAGRIYINLQGGPVPHHQQHHQQSHHQGPSHGQQHHGQQHKPSKEDVKTVTGLLKLVRSCCVIM
jgi:DNA-nicking Smr family endonuclease